MTWCNRFVIGNNNNNSSVLLTEACFTEKVAISHLPFRDSPVVVLIQYMLFNCFTAVDNGLRKNHAIYFLYNSEHNSLKQLEPLAVNMETVTLRGSYICLSLETSGFHTESSVMEKSFDGSFEK